MYTCANCAVVACGGEDRSKLPANCPMRDQENLEEILKTYEEPENHKFYVEASAMEADGYCQWPRLKETVELCKRMGYQKVGLAFSRGLKKEAKVVADLLRSQGFQVVSVICKTGGFPKEAAGSPRTGCWPTTHAGRFIVRMGILRSGYKKGSPLPEICGGGENKRQFDSAVLHLY